jgi:hypothetical protein
MNLSSCSARGLLFPIHVAVLQLIAIRSGVAMDKVDPEESLSNGKFFSFN